MTDQQLSISLAKCLKIWRKLTVKERDNKIKEWFAIFCSNKTIDQNVIILANALDYLIPQCNQNKAY